MNDDVGGNDIDVDSLLQGLETPAPERAMSETQAPAAEVAPAPQSPQELEFSWNGKQIKAPFTDPRVKQWAQQGYDYNIRMSEFKQKQEKLDLAQKAYDQNYKRYQEVDQYAAKNPDWWNKVSQAFENKDQIQNNDPVMQKVSQLAEKLNQTESFIQGLKAQEQQAKIKQEDTALHEEMESIRKQYSDLDLSTPDEAGKTLEYKVLEFAQQKGITDFTVAFKAFNHEKLVQLASEKAKEAVSKEAQKNKKLGLLGKTQAPTKGITDPRNLKSQSYEALMAEAMEELGIN